MIVRVTIVSALGLTLSTANVLARDWYFEPELAVSAGFDDNPRLEAPSVEDADQDAAQAGIIEDQTIGVVGGEFRFASESESDLIAFDAEFNARRYTDSVLDSELVQSAILYEKRGLNHDFDTELGYTTDSTIETELIDTGILKDSIDRQEVYFNSGVTSRFSDKWEGEFSFGYSDIAFDGNVQDIEDSFTEYEELRASAELVRIISERLEINGTSTLLQFDPSNTVDVGEIEKEDFVTVLLGLEYKLSERFDVSASAGTGFRDVEVATEQGQDQFSSNEPDYKIRLEYAGLRNSVDFELSETLRSSADGGLAKTRGASLRLSRPETLGGTFDLQLSYINREPVRGDTIERDYYSVSPGIEWRMNENLYLSVIAEYREQDTRDSATALDTNADSSAVTFGARYVFGRKRL